MLSVLLVLFRDVVFRRSFVLDSFRSLLVRFLRFRFVPTFDDELSVCLSVSLSYFFSFLAILLSVVSLPIEPPPPPLVRLVRVHQRVPALMPRRRLFLRPLSLEACVSVACSVAHAGSLHLSSASSLGELYTEGRRTHVPSLYRRGVVLTRADGACKCLRPSPRERVRTAIS